MNDERYTRINFTDFAKEYYNYLHKKENTDDSSLNITTLNLDEEGPMSNEYKAFMKKFNNCFSFFGLKDTGFLKLNNDYAIFRKDVDFFCHLIYEYTRPDSYLKNAKKNDIISSLEEEKLLCDIEQLMRIIKSYVNAKEYESVISSIIDKTEYYYLCCITDIRYIEGLVRDIIESTVYSSKKSAVNPYYFLNKDDRISSFKELRKILEDFKQTMESKDSLREAERVKQFESYVREQNEDISDFLYYYTIYRQIRNLGSYTLDFLSSEKVRSHGIYKKRFLEFCRAQGCSDTEKVKKQIYTYIRLRDEFTVK